MLQLPLGWRREKTVREKLLSVRKSCHVFHVNVDTFVSSSQTVAPVCSAPHFRLLRVCEQNRNKGKLEGIDALLGEDFYHFLFSFTPSNQILNRELFLIPNLNLGMRLWPIHSNCSCVSCKAAQW